MSIKNRVRKIEENQPKPKRNIEYIAYWGHEEPDRPGELISVKGSNPAIETYKLPDGSLKEVWHYKTEWPGPPLGGISLKNERGEKW